MSIRANAGATANGRVLKHVFVNGAIAVRPTYSRRHTPAMWASMAVQAGVAATSGDEHPPRATGVLP